MADNTTLNTGTGGDVIATDDVTTLNGGASSGVKVQRVKVLYGDDGTATDVSTTNPLPTTSAAIGAAADASASSDTGTFSLIALTKRMLTKLPSVGQTTMSASQSVTVASDQSTIPVNQAGVSASGSLAALNASVALTLNGAPGWAVDLRGTFTATVTFQGTIDGTNWFTIAMLPAGGTVNVATVTTSAAAGAWVGSATGLQQVRATATAYTSGTVTVVLRAMQAVGVVQSLPTGATSQTIGTVSTVTTVTTVTGVTTVSAVTAANLNFPQTIADVASAALTTTTTTAAFTPTFGCSYQINIPVTAVTGTSPTLDVVVQESDDAGTNWFDVYHFPRITATGMYRSPIMALTGNRVRYVQTVAGTTPSFTRAVNRLQVSSPAPIVRGLIDRAIAPNTLNSASSALTADGCTTFTLTVVSGAGATVAPVYGIQISDDNSNWADTGVSLTVAASVNVTTSLSGVVGRFARMYIKSAGTGATQTYAVLRAVG